MRKFIFAAAILAIGGLAGAQQVQLLESDPSEPQKAAAAAADETPQIIMPSEEAPAAEVKKPEPPAVKKAAKPAAVKKSGKAKAQPAAKPAVKPAAPAAPVTAAPAAVPVKPAVAAAPPAPAVKENSAVVKTVAPGLPPAAEDFPQLEAIPAAANPAEAVKPAAPAKPAAVPAAPVKPAEAVKAPASVKPAAVPAAPAKPAEAAKPPAPVKPVEVVKAPAPAAAVKPVEKVRSSFSKALAPAPAVKKSPARKSKVQLPTPIPPPEPKTEGGFVVTKTHIVTKGDTLWDLSARYYSDPFKWGKIYNANLNVVTNPDRIDPKEELVIPEVMEEVKPAPQKEIVIGEGDTVKDAEVTSAEVAQPAAPAVEPVKAAAPKLKDASDGADLSEFSEDMPEHQKEWAAGIQAVPDSWREDGVVSARKAADEDGMGDGLSLGGETVYLSMARSGMVKPGDYLAVYMKGADAYDKAGRRLGREIQAAGMLEVLEADGSAVKARVIDAVTPISKGYVVKKK
jgi:LysM repeat protein